MKDNAYYFHQTPVSLVKDLLQRIPFVPGDTVADPFRGEGAFYNNFPEYTTKDWAEKTDGKDYLELSGNKYDWIITNPPFRLEVDGKRENSFWSLLNHYTVTTKKGIAFLGNDRCLASLTPLRLQILKVRGWSIQQIIVCSVKKWRGRYYFIIFRREPVSCFDYLLPNYE